MSKNIFIPLLGEDGKITGIKDNRRDKVLTWNDVAKELNDYEEGRQRRKAKIAKFEEREDRFQRVIGGIKAYLELEANDDLWWEWNE